MRSRLANLLTRLGLRLLDAATRMDRPGGPLFTERELADRRVASDRLLEPMPDTARDLGWTDAGDLPAGERPWPTTWESGAVWRSCGGVHVWERVAVYPPSGRSIDGEFVIRCARCHVPRCGHSTDANPCMRRRHHRGDHVRLHGTPSPPIIRGETEELVLGYGGRPKRQR